MSEVWAPAVCTPHPGPAGWPLWPGTHTELSGLPGGLWVPGGFGSGWVRVGRSSPRPVAPASAWLSHEALARGRGEPSGAEPLGGLPKPAAAARTLTGRATVWRGLPSGCAREQPWPRRGPLAWSSFRRVAVFICHGSASGRSGRLQTRHVGSCWDRRSDEALAVLVLSVGGAARRDRALPPGDHAWEGGVLFFTQ